MKQDTQAIARCAVNAALQPHGHSGSPDSWTLKRSSANPAVAEMNPAGHVRRVASFFGVRVESFYLVSEHDVHVSLIRNVGSALAAFRMGCASVSSMISRKRITN